MAWFSKTLTDMKKAIEKEDWEEAKRILDLHNEYVNTTGEKEVKYDLSKMAIHIQAYHEILEIISRSFKEKKPIVGTDKIMIIAKVQEAISYATQFETILLDLVKIGKKLK